MNGKHGEELEELQELEELKRQDGVGRIEALRRLDRRKRVKPPPPLFRWERVDAREGPANFCAVCTHKEQMTAILKNSVTFNHQLQQDHNNNRPDCSPFYSQIITLCPAHYAKMQAAPFNVESSR